MFQSCTVNSRNRFAFRLEFLTRALHHIPKMIKGAPVNGIKRNFYIVFDASNELVSKLI
jgi:hypothetical protein